MAPPINGPATEAKQLDNPMTPVYIGRLEGSTTKATIMYAPVPMPAHPIPAIARPIMRASELGAAPHSRLPSSNRPIEPRNVHLRGKYLYALPHDAWKLPEVKKKAEPYHEAMSSRWNSSVILGIAVATIVWVRSMLDTRTHEQRGNRQLGNYSHVLYPGMTGKH